MTDESKAVLNPGEKVQPDVSKEEAGRLLQCLYGMSAIEVEELSSYDDKNFHIHVDTSNDVNLSENGYVLKILNSLDSKFPEAIGMGLYFLHQACSIVFERLTVSHVICSF